MKDTLVVGDIHGKLDIVESVLKSPYDAIFVGDFLDSYDNNFGDQIQALLLVLNAIDSNDGVTALMGNHELSYLLKGQGCSGYHTKTERMVSAIGKDRIFNTLRPYIWKNDFLITHAGVSADYLEHKNITLDEYLADESRWYDIGYARGGTTKFGAHYWNDFFKEFRPIPNVKQIFGHTGWRPNSEAGEGIMTWDDNYLIDCLDYKKEVLLLRENGDVDKIGMDLLR